MLSTWKLEPSERPDFCHIVSEIQLYATNLDNSLSPQRKIENSRLSSLDSGNHTDSATCSDGGSVLGRDAEEDYLVPESSIPSYPAPTIISSRC